MCQDPTRCMIQFPDNDKTWICTECLKEYLSSDQEKKKIDNSK